VDSSTLNAALILGGLLALVTGGDLLVRGAVAIARRLKVSRLMIGLTLVGFGTSTPELVTSLEGAAAGSPGIAVGNVVGSNIANILLILGLAAVISPLRVDPRALRRDGAAVLLAAGVCAAAVVLDALERWVGGALVALLLAYVVFVYRRERHADDASARMHDHQASAAATAHAPARPWVAAALCLAGLVLMIFGARALVGGSVGLARSAGVSETVIGLTVVAVGTSLPELMTSVVAALRRQGDVAFGNILGSNIFNIFGILGLTALLAPIPVPAELARLDIWVMLGATLVLVYTSATGGRLGRAEGLVFLMAYAAYTGYLVFG
jgi:cation:H+ antiporter